MEKPALKFGHLTDIHLPLGDTPSARAVLNKRLLGLLSWKRKRHARHLQWVSDALVEDLREQSCDAALISGDLVNIALPSEFGAAQRWMERSFDGMSVVFTPGNHDTYVQTDWDETLGLLASYMTGLRAGEMNAREAASADDFPFLCEFGGGENKVAVISANSSPPTAPGLASGKLGEEQLQRIKQLLSETKDSFQILMLHHPVNDGVVSARKGLDDRRALRTIIAEVGVDLILHGHAHAPSEGVVETPNGAAPVIGGGSASHPEAHGKYTAGRYNLFTVSRAGAEWELQMDVREIEPTTRNVRTVESLTFTRPAQRA